MTPSYVPGADRPTRGSRDQAEIYAQGPMLTLSNRPGYVRFSTTAAVDSVHRGVVCRTRAVARYPSLCTESCEPPEYFCNDAHHRPGSRGPSSPSHARTRPGEHQRVGACGSRAIRPRTVE
ncbi:hypothetical protein GCM10023235_16840 [Kitasatospora terrestris]|uniref:Uncharacterized protein n=1 Tax=Kitasatospora terrestris TaxID=258051 RepID=A0ABP9DJT6_9ACTN